MAMPASDELADELPASSQLPAIVEVAEEGAQADAQEERDDLRMRELRRAAARSGRPRSAPGRHTRRHEGRGHGQAAGARDRVRRGPVDRRWVVDRRPAVAASRMASGVSRKLTRAAAKSGDEDDRQRRRAPPGLTTRAGRARGSARRSSWTSVGSAASVPAVVAVADGARRSAGPRSRISALAEAARRRGRRTDPDAGRDVRRQRVERDGVLVDRDADRRRGAPRLPCRSRRAASRRRASGGCPCRPRRPGAVRGQRLGQHVRVVDRARACRRGTRRWRPAAAPPPWRR